MKKFLLKFSKSKWSKVLACCLICTVFLSMFAISSSAATSFDKATFTFSFYRGAAWVCNGPNDTVLFEDGIAYVTSVDFNTVELSSFSGNCIYYVLSVSCNFSSITINDVSYTGVTYSPMTNVISHSDLKSYSFVGSSSNYSADVSYVYLFYIPVLDLDSYNEYYLDGFNDGVASETAKQKWYPQGFEAGVKSDDAKNKWYPQGYEAGYAAGLNDGLNSSGSENLGQNLIGDTLSAPLRALNQFQLFTSPGGTVVTLGMVFGSLIALTLLFAFLKLFGI